MYEFGGTGIPKGDLGSEKGAGAKIGHEWRRLGTNGENVEFFHSRPLHGLGHEWRAVGREWARSGTNRERNW